MPSIYYSPQFDELVYKDDKEEMPISKLSAGYQSLLWDGYGFGISCLYA